MNTSLYVVRGPIGVGKSSTVRALHENLDNTASIVEIDGIKRMIDPTTSSQWRREISTDTALFMVDRLLQVPRTTIIEAHSKYPEVVDRLATLALRNSAQLVNVLLTAPLEVCIDRAAGRNVPEISYAIDAAMVTDYYCNLEPNEGDLVFDTTKMNAAQIADSVLGQS